MEWIWFLLIGATAGWLAAKLTGKGGYGLPGNLLLGVVGAVLGGFVLGLIGFHGSGILARLITATLGAVLVLWFTAWLARQQKKT